jgi:hypothetical protein
VSCLGPYLNIFLTKVSGTESGRFCSCSVASSCSFVVFSGMSKICTFGQFFVVGCAVNFNFLNSSDSPSFSTDGHVDSTRIALSRHSTIFSARIPKSLGGLDVRIRLVSADV